MNCVICLEDIDEVNRLVTVCNHHFHSSCFFEYMYNRGIHNTTQNLLCPVCRNDLVVVQVRTPRIPTSTETPRQTQSDRRNYIWKYILHIGICLTIILLIAFVMVILSIRNAI